MVMSNGIHEMWLDAQGLCESAGKWHNRKGWHLGPVEVLPR